MNDQRTHPVGREHRPEMLAVTWKMYGDEGWVQARRSPSNGGTLLKLEHIL